MPLPQLSLYFDSLTAWELHTQNMQYMTGRDSHSMQELRLILIQGAKQGAHSAQLRNFK